MPDSSSPRLREVKTHWRGHLLFWSAVLLMLFGGAILKLPALQKGAPNLEASYHALLTVSALNESPAAEHHFLPSVSLGSAYDKDIAWGATVRLPSGHYVYTSFAAPAFVAPFAFFRITHLPIGLSGLMLFNFLLQAVATVALAGLLTILTRGQNGSGRRSLAIVAGLSVQIFSSEALLAYGIIYWAQQLYQILLLCSLICVAQILTRDGRQCRVPIAILTVLSFLGPWTEWTGFVFNGGLALYFAWRGLSERRFLWIAALISVATAGALLVLVMQYAVNIGLTTTLQAFASRFLVRTVKRSGPWDLLYGHAASFGLLLPLAGLAVLVLGRARTGAGINRAGAMPLVVLGLAIFPLLENLVMMQHAAQFSFDRLKAAVPVAISLTLACGLLDARWRKIGFMLLVGALIQNCVIYRMRLTPYTAWQAIDSRNQGLARKIGKLVDRDCAVLTSALTVRGYANLLFHRGIQESLSRAEFERAAATPRGVRCGAVYLEGRTPFPDMPDYSTATVWREGRIWQTQP